MSIPNDSEEINRLEPETVSFAENGHIEDHSVFKNYFLPLLFVLVAVLSFGIGKLSATKSNPGINIKYDPSLTNYQGMTSDKKTENSATVIKTVETGDQKEPTIQAQTSLDGEVFASSKGKRYYYPGCKSTIVEKNKITFATKEMAESAGYTLASGCKPQ